MKNIKLLIIIGVIVEYVSLIVLIVFSSLIKYYLSKDECFSNIYTIISKSSLLLFCGTLLFCWLVLWIGKFKFQNNKVLYFLVNIPIGIFYFYMDYVIS